MNKFITLFLFFLPMSLFGLESSVSNPLSTSGGTLTGDLTAPNITATYGVSAATGVFSGAVSISSATPQGLFVVGAGSTPNLFINNNKMGINISSPNRVLHINDPSSAVTTGLMITNGTTGNALTDGIHLLYGADNIGYISLKENNPLHFETNAITRMAIAGPGNVGIGTTSPSYKLHISTGSIYMDGTGSGIYPNASTTLPTTGYNEGSLYYNKTDHTLYISTETVTGAFSWKSVW